MEVAVWSRQEVAANQAMLLIPKIQELLGIERFQLRVADNPAFWGAGGAVPDLMPALGALGLEGLRKVTQAKSHGCEATWYGVPARCS